MNKPVYLGLSIQQLRKMLMHEFQYDYVISKYGEKTKQLASNSFAVYIKTDDVYRDIAEDVETRFNTSNYELDRPLPKGKIEKVIGLTKDELDGKIMTKFVALRAKIYSHLKDRGCEVKKTKVTKKCVIKRKFQFEKYKNCLEATKPDNKRNCIEENKIEIDSINKNHKKSIKNDKSILKNNSKDLRVKDNFFP